MLSFFTVEPYTLELLRHLMRHPLFSRTRLVGGTALALQLGHRQSIDIDLFGHIDANHEEIRSVLREMGELLVLKESKNINIYIVNGVKVDIVNYSYPWLRPSLDIDGLRIASFEDIAAMKINAIIGRGTKKDFIDLSFILDRCDIDCILSLYKEKYTEQSLFMAYKSLAYFEDAELQQMPKMFVPRTWEDIKASIIEKL